MLLGSLITKFRLNYRESRLCRSLISKPSITELGELMSFLADEARSVPIANARLRNALFSLPSWDIPKAHQDLLFMSVERYLVANIEKTLPVEWIQWIKFLRTSGRYIDVSNAATCNALREALRSGKLDKLETLDQDFLLECFRKHHERVLDLIGLEREEEALPVLLELGSLGHILKPSSTSVELMRRWVEGRQAHPRSLAAFTPEQAYAAPLRGVASPNGVSVTIYHSPGSSIPTRISCAGSTGDLVLNSQIFTSMFAAALSCNSEPTFVMTTGATLSLNPAVEPINIDERHSYLSAAIGPAGFARPSPGSPTLELEPEEALALISDFLGKVQQTTGLTQVTHWNFADAQQLETRIINALEKKDGFVRFRSDPDSTESSGVIHVLPLLHRNENDEVVPVEIRVPYHVLSPQDVFGLLRTARENYMQQLIADGRRREVMARKAFAEQDMRVKEWQAMPLERKVELCREYPFVTVSQSYDFELGIIRPVKPYKIDRNEYEDEYRPRVRRQAAEYKAKFAALCEKLTQLNKRGGRADVLTFKLLLDSMLRRAPLAIEHESFQKEYDKWVASVSDPVWIALEVWASQRGLLPELLAADNVVFNAKLELDGQSIVIQPYVMVDLHDFVAVIDCHKGLMEVLPAGTSPIFRDILISDPKHQITDLPSLHKEFCDWVNHTLHLVDARKREVAAAEARLHAHRNFSTLIQLQQVKHLLSKGMAGKAAQIVDGIRSADIAPVYLWGAIAYQYLFLEHNQKGLNLGHLLPQERSEQLFNHAFARVIASLRGGEVPFGKRGEEYLRQLVARDKKFVEKLIAPNPHGHSLEELERQSLGMSADELEELKAAIFAISSLELLNLAETMCALADDLPVGGTDLKTLREVLNRIVEMEYSLTLMRPSCAVFIEELPDLLNTRADAASS